MILSARDITTLTKIIASLEDIVAHADKPEGERSKGSPAAALQLKTRIRRTGKELANFRKLLLSERNKGVPVSEIARKHAVSVAYVYQL
jgi:DNA invertase Pin-like site-specific DNA recombinase